MNAIDVRNAEPLRLYASIAALIESKIVKSHLII